MDRIEKPKLSKQQLLMLIAIFVACCSKQVYQITSIVVSNITESYPNIPTATVATLTTTPRNIGGLITAFIMGPLLAKVNKKDAYTFMLILQLIFCGVFYFLGGATSFWVLYAATILIGGLFGGHAVAVNSLLKQNFDEKRAASYISLYNVFVNGGQVVYQYLAGNLAAGNGGADWPKAFLPGLIMTVPCLIVWLILMPRKMGEPVAKENSGNKEKQKISVGIFSLGLVLILIVNFCYYFAQNGYNSGISLYIVKENGLGTSVQTALASNIQKICNVIVSGTYPIWQKALKKWMVPAGLGITFIAVTILVLPASLTNAYIASALVGGGNALMFGSLAAKAMMTIKPGFEPIAAALVNITNNLASMFSVQVNTALGAMIAEGYRGRFACGMIFAGIGTIVAIIAFVGDGKYMHKFDQEQAA